MRTILILSLLMCLAWTTMAQTAPRPQRPAAAPVVRSVRGEILRVDIEANTFVVGVVVRQQTQETLFSTDEKTQFVLDGEPATLVDLRRYMRVTVTPDSGTATRVVARSLSATELKKRKAQDSGK